MNKKLFSFFMALMMLFYFEVSVQAAGNPIIEKLIYTYDDAGQLLNNYSLLNGETQRMYDSSGNLVSEEYLRVPAVLVSAGSCHTGVVKADGSLWMFGSGGELGVVRTGAYDNTPIKVFESGVKAVACGASFTLILMDDGSVWSCGTNSRGQLGDGTTVDSSVPKKIFEGDCTAVYAGMETSAVVKADGSLWTFGSGWYGKLGNGRADLINSVPEKVIDSGVKTVSAGGWHTAVIKNDGSLWMFGSNRVGNFGDGTTLDSLIPKKIIDSGIKGVSASFANNFTAIIKDDGSLWMCGVNGNGQLGDGTRENRANFTKIMDGDIQSVAAGMTYTTVVKSDGSLWGFGRTNYLELGFWGPDQLTPVKIIDSGVQQISSGYWHSVYSTEDGSVGTFGWNTHGQLGYGNSGSYGTPIIIMQ